jgi:hypothetical protein
MEEIRISKWKHPTCFWQTLSHLIHLAKSGDQKEYIDDRYISHVKADVNPITIQVPSWSWSYGSWIYNFLCNRDRSVVFSGHSVSSTNKTDRHDITEILLKVVLNTIKPNLSHTWILAWEYIHNFILVAFCSFVLIYWITNFFNIFSVMKYFVYFV